MQGEVERPRRLCSLGHGEETLVITMLRIWVSMLGLCRWPRVYALYLGFTRAARYECPNDPRGRGWNGHPLDLGRPRPPGRARPSPDTDPLLRRGLDERRKTCIMAHTPLVAFVLGWFPWSTCRAVPGVEPPKLSVVPLHLRRCRRELHRAKRQRRFASTGASPTVRRRIEAFDPP